MQTNNYKKHLKQNPSLNHKKQRFISPFVAFLLSLILITIAFNDNIYTFKFYKAKVQKYFVFENKEKIEVYAFTPIDPDLFFASQVTPALNEYHIRNKQAVRRAISNIENGIDKIYNDGIDNFIENITDTGSSIKILYKSGKDIVKGWWGSSDTNSTKEYTTKLFRYYVLSEKKLQKLYQEIIIHFNDDLEASQNKLEADIIDSWENSEFERGVGREEQKNILNKTLKSLQTLKLKEVKKYALIKDMKDIIFLVSPSGFILTKLKSIGSAIIGGSRLGSISGSLGGLANISLGSLGGWIIGASVFAIGYIFDDWIDSKISDKLKPKIKKQTKKQMEEFKHIIIEGKNKQPGFRYMLNQIIQQLEVTNKIALKKLAQRKTQ